MLASMIYSPLSYAKRFLWYAHIYDLLFVTTFMTFHIILSTVVYMQKPNHFKFCFTCTMAQFANFWYDGFIDNNDEILNHTSLRKTPSNNPCHWDLHHTGMFNLLFFLLNINSIFLTQFVPLWELLGLLPST